MRDSRCVRYLVVLPPHQTRTEASFRDVDTDEPLAVGDKLLVDDLLMRVRVAVDVPFEVGYDATLVCTPDE